MMGIYLDDERGGLVLADLDEGSLPILEALPKFARGEGSELFLNPSVVRGNEAVTEEGKEMNEDWAEFVAPDLQTLFDEQLQRVEADMEAAEPSVGVPGAVDVVIAPSHLEAWFGALNQARLAMNEEFDCEAIEEPEAHDPNVVEKLTDEQHFAMHHFMFYRFLQEMVMQAMRVSGLMEIDDQSGDDE
ncbi:DUF2017 family protein [Sulfuriroseicoccus oceanibius]|uniref:DUF2017 family protein n=1 Tax=Sulfuriroseicoccus oceanibius TaxID=2707525 RepID=A0A6B3L4H4_9BACT|nr:DUF2017 family protein [Sulfuriroseicoccus oceanibius]QQL43699.1 DUF2017 family protein [Sulfuriroseicoccus oceanibius]